MWKEVRGVVTPGRVTTASFIVGTAVWVTLYGIVLRRRRLKRIEQKIEVVAQEVT